ncbi:MAG: hypothetical protein IJ193_04990 [Bacilli bacterium]|nr:hypothetical protein [Bacilli bacterium]
MNNDKQQVKVDAEELARTQVLNLEELRQVAKYEKKVSKKPAIICAILGAFMIMIGAGSQGFIMLSQKNVTPTRQSNISQRNTKVEKKEPEKVIQALTCSMSNPNNANGTNTESHFTFSFEDDQLKSETKIFIVDMIAGNALGQSSMQNLQTAYKAYEATNGTVEGFNVLTAPRESYGFSVTTQIDLAKLDMSKISTNIQANPQLKVDFPLNTTLETVRGGAESSGYTCELSQN